MPRRLSPQDQKYLESLYVRRQEIIDAGVESYSTRTRSLKKLDLNMINKEIARLEGGRKPQFMRVTATDR